MASVNINTIPTFDIVGNPGFSGDVFTSIYFSRFHERKSTLKSNLDKLRSINKISKL